MSENETIAISRFDSIRTRLILAFILIVLLPMAFISAVLSISGSEGAQLQLSSQLETVVSFKESAILTWAATLKNELAGALIGENTPALYNRPWARADGYDRSADRRQGAAGTFPAPDDTL